MPLVTKGKIRDAVKAVLLDLNPSGVGRRDVQVLKRLRHDTLTTTQSGLVVVALKERVAQQMFGGWSWLVYPVAVVLVLNRNNRAEDADAEDRIRNATRLALWKPTMAGVPEVFRTDYDPEPELDLSSWGESWEPSAQRFDFWTSEKRTL